MNRIKDELKEYYGITNEEEIKVNAYGLTGAGVIFINSTLKVQARFNNSFERFSLLAEDLKERIN